MGIESILTPNEGTKIVTAIREASAALVQIAEEMKRANDFKAMVDKRERDAAISRARMGPM